MSSVVDDPESDALMRSGVDGDAVVAGGGATTMRPTGLDVVELPAASVAIAVMVCEPPAMFAEGVNVHAPAPFAVVVPSTVAPSLITMVALASAVPVKVGVRLVVEEPSVGEVIATAGPVVSTVTAKAGEAAEMFPAASVEVVVNECTPAASAPVV